MEIYKMSEEEKKYLEKYNISSYERPSIAADIAVFSILPDGDNHNIRKLPQKALKILLIKRANYPYKDSWALPGGFCHPSEDVYETARRELFEETSVKDAYMNHLGIFGEIGRDPRGWIISNSFLALLDGENCKLRAGTDAWEARWFSVDVLAQELNREAYGDRIRIETKYTLTLKCDETDTILSSEIMEYKEFCNYHEKNRLELPENHGIAFDHAKIILSGIKNLRYYAENDARIIFDFMPEKFTLTQLQNAFELVLTRKLLPANFRRKIMEYVIETDEILEGNGYRPAKLFKRNVEAFYTTQKTS